MIEAVEYIFNEIKKKYPTFENRTYDTTGNTIYFGMPSGAPSGLNGNGFKLYKEDNKWKLGVKSDLRTGKLTDYIFVLPAEKENAKVACFKLYQIENTITTIKDRISNKDAKLIDEFKKELAKSNISFSERIGKNFFGYHFEFSDTFSAFRILIEDEELVVKIKKYAPLDDSKNSDDSGIKKFKLINNVDSCFRSPIKAIKYLYDSCKLYNELNGNNLLTMLKDEILKEVTIISDSFEYGSLSIVLSDKKKIVISKEKNIYYAKVYKEKEDNLFEFDIDSVPEIINFLFDKQVAPPPPPPTTKKEISESAKIFLDEINSLPINPTAEQLDNLFNLFEELSDEDLKNKDVLYAYQILCSYLSNEEPPSQVRFIYTSKSFLKEITDINEDLKEELNNILKQCSCLKGKEFNEYLVSKKRLCYIKNYLKIRVKSGIKDRIIFCYGDMIGKNKKDIYLFNYNTTHNFNNLDNIRPTEQQYVLWKGDNKSSESKDLPPLTTKQEEISTKIEKPVICTGCAGSGKTLISVYMYLYILDKIYNSDSHIGEKELIYITYNENAKLNAVNQLNQVIETINAKTIYEFLSNLATPDLNDDSKYVDEKDFTYWWKNKISDHNLRLKMNSLAVDAIRYVYTLFRGVYKGSMYRWESNSNSKTLTKTQFLDILDKEPISKENSELIFHICKIYQEYMEENNMYDDNDLARIVAKRGERGLARLYRYIIVDEVQDLTEVQLDAIVKCSINKRCLYFFGDQNQSINPTILDINNIEMCLQLNDSSISHNDIFKLNSSYRFGPLLANYINHLVKLKKDWIGALAVEETESSNKYPEKNKWAGKTTDKSLINEMLKRASNSANSIIIVPDEKVKLQLKDKYGDEFIKRVTTIYDSKGLEWDYVVLYNMIKFNEDKFKEMINLKAKHSTLHRMIFNQYYVGCTRALSCFSVLEENLNEDVNKAIIGELQTITQNYIDLYLTENNDSVSWLNEAERLFNQGNYELAKAAFDKSSLEEDDDKRITVCNIMLSEEKRKDIKNAEFCRINTFYKEASKIYLANKNLRLSKLMDLYCGINISEEEAWDILNNEALINEDIEVLNKNGYFTRKSESIKKKMEELNKLLGGQ